MIVRTARIVNAPQEFVFGFQNGVQTQFNFVDLDTIINDMITIWEGVQNGSIAYSA